MGESNQARIESLLFANKAIGHVTLDVPLLIVITTDLGTCKFN